MNKKSIIMTTIVTFLVGVIMLLASTKNTLFESAKSYYQVYLNGQNLGIIKEANELYNLINEEQTSIKEKYGVSTVYPPTDLKVIATNSFNSSVSNVRDIYELINEKDHFTIRGYVVEIKGEESDFKINVLDKEVFYNAAKRFVKAFLSENEYENYINNTQKEIEATGHIIQDMYFKENISIKESFISINDKIYTEELELSQYLLFGDNPDTKHYTIKLGDTISSISEANKLNSEEFLIANPTYKDEKTILRVGDSVNVTLINPKLSFVYELYDVSDEIDYFLKTTVADATKLTSYRVVTTAGVNGITRVTEKYAVTNGVRSQGVEILKQEVIRPKVNQVTTYGTKVNIPSGYNPPPVQIDGDWGWPTNSGYVITSYFEWRWGQLHNGLDISGAGNFGSNIYAAADGTVIRTFNSCPSIGSGYGDRCGGGLGNLVIIDHGNGYYTTYGHLHQNVRVSVGAKVTKGQIIGYMGSSGSSTGPHVHFSVSQGSVSGGYFDPLRLYR